MNINKTLKYIAVTGIFAVPFVPLLVFGGLFFPYVTGKAFAFRIIVEIILACWAILAIRDRRYRPELSIVPISVLIFTAVIFVADFFAFNAFKSFWSNFERMEGFISIAHLVAYFFVASAVLVREKIWDRFWSVSIIASVLVSIYGYMQILGKVDITQGGVRLDSTLGNAAYLAVYVMVHIFLCLYFIVKRNTSKSLRWVYAAVAVLETVILYHTETRGAILGFVAGLVVASVAIIFTEKDRKWVRNLAVAFLSACILIVGGFFLIKNSEFVANNRVLKRFSSISLTEKTTISRFLVWNMAFQGFKDKPILGWGQEGFNYVFTKYFEPKMFGQEDWFDRTHNVFLDWLVAGGILGLMSYLGIIASFIYVIWKKTNLGGAEKGVLSGLTAGYFIHNLFVFDNLTSYIILFSLLAFAYAAGRQDFYSFEPEDSRLEFSPREYYVSAAVLVLFVISIYFLNVKPINANLNLISALQSANKSDPAQSMEYFKKALSYNTFGDREIAEHLSYTAMRAVSGNYSTETKQKLFSLAMNNLEEQIKKNPGDARSVFFAGGLLSGVGMYKEAIPYLEKAVSLSPSKQQIIFSLGEACMNSGDTKKSLQQFKKAFELEPSYDNARIFYAGALIYSGNNTEAQKILVDRFGTDLVQNDFIMKAYLDTKQYGKAIEISKKAVEQNPGDLQANASLSAMYFLAGQKQNSISQIRKMISDNPGFKTQGEKWISDIFAGKNPGI